MTVKNLTLPSTNNLTLGVDKNLVLLSIERKMRGVSRILQDYEVERKGVYAVQMFISIEQKMRGHAYIYQTNEVKQRGYSFIFQNNEVERKGVYYIFDDFIAQSKGRIRIENNAVEGYVVYIGYGSMPDFTSPDEFSDMLPIDVSIIPPVSGTENLYITLRKRNRYNLESQNQQVKIITIDTNGDEALGNISAPIGAEMTAIIDEGFLIAASYPGYNTDTNKANTWKIYVKADTPPVPGVDIPVATGSIKGTTLQVSTGPYPDGNKTYYLAVTVYRTEDSEESAASESSLVLPADPLTPVSVKSGLVV